MIVDKLFNEVDKNENNLHPEGNGWNVLMDIFGNNSRKKIREGNADVFDDIYACINILSDDVAKLPIKVFKKEDEKIRRIKKRDHPIAKLLSGRPNDFMNISDYVKLLMVDLLINGNHFSLMKFNEKGEVTELLPLTAETTKPVKDKITGQLLYQTIINNQTKHLLPWEVIHLKGFTRDGIHGKSPIRVIQERVQANELANEFNSTMLEQSGTPKGILKVPGSLNADARDKAKKEWKRVNGKDAIAVIDSGLEYQQLGMSQEDMQFIESQKFNTQKIAAIFKVPLHKINEMGRATYNNIEHQALEYVKNALQPWITRIEIEFDTKIFTQEEQDDEYYIKFNLDSELRGDSKTRAEVQKLQVESGLITLDEGRSDNERSPYEKDWSQTPFITLNWTQADNLVQLQNKKVGLGDMKGGDIDEKGDSSDNDDDQPTE